MQSCGNDGAMTRICYDGFYQNRMDDKMPCGPIFLPMRSLGPAILSHLSTNCVPLPNNDFWTTIGAAIVSGRGTKDGTVGADLPKPNAVRCMTCRIIGVASPSSSFGLAARMPAIQKTFPRASKRLRGSMPTCGRYAYSRP